jgi:hypothetical protein
MTASSVNVRSSCLLPFIEGWTQPTAVEVRELLRVGNLTGKQASQLVGLADTRTIRRWTSGETPIPYAAWALLCHVSGLGVIWVGTPE